MVKNVLNCHTPSFFAQSLKFIINPQYSKNNATQLFSMSQIMYCYQQNKKKQV